MVVTRRQRNDEEIPETQPQRSQHTSNHSNSGNDNMPPGPHDQPPVSPNGGDSGNEQQRSQAGSQRRDNASNRPPSGQRSGADIPPSGGGNDPPNPPNPSNPPNPPNNPVSPPHPAHPPAPFPPHHPSSIASHVESASLAGPGQRARQLMGLADPFDRFTYLAALEKINETFARQLRQKGVEIPGCEPFSFPY